MGSAITVVSAYLSSTRPTRHPVVRYRASS